MRNACCGIAAACLWSIASAVAQEAVYDFRITDNTMGGALSELARQAHVELLYPYQMARIRGVNSVVGRYTVTEALELLLKGTGYSGGLTKQGIITISLRSEGYKPEGNAMSPETKKTLSIFSLLLGSVSAQATFTQAAQAQAADSPEATVETVVVTGFRESLANALEKKRHSTLIMEAVAPEDVGKMPDVNVAESLQRLPGVQIDRAGGEGTQVRIRGLSYNVTLLNGDVFVTGREMYTTGEGSGAGNGNLFQNSLEGIPSALISGVNVYKSPNASLVAGALGGTIDLTTRNPLDGKDGLSIGGNLGGSYSEGTDNMVPNGTVIASYNYNSKIGVIAALSYDEHNVRIFEAQSQNRNGWTVAGPATGVDNNLGVDYIEPELSYLTHQTVDRQRFGTFLGLTYRPIDSIETSLTWFHSFLTIQRVDITNKVFIHSNGEASGLDASEPYTIDPNGVVMLGTFRSNSAEGSTMVEKDRNIGDNLQFNVKYDDGGKFRFSAKFAYGSGKMYSEFVQADFRQSGYGIDSANGDFTGLTGQIAGNNYANPLGCGGNKIASATDCGFTYINRKGLHPVVSYDVSDLLTNPEYIIFKSHWGWDVKSKNDQWSLRADAEYDVFDKVMVTGGLRYASKQVDYDFGRFLLNAYGDGTCSFTDSTHTAGVTMCPQGQGQLSWETDTTHRGPWTYYQDPSLPFVPVQTGSSNPERLTMVNDFFPTAGINKMLAQNPDPMLASPKAWLQSINPDAPLKRYKDAINSFKISRITTEGYFMIDLGDADDDLHVNTGVRVVNTLLKIGQYELASDPVYVSTATWNGLPDISATTYSVTSRQYTDILPSLNVVYNLYDNQKIRFSAARVMAEQNYWDLGAGKYYNFTRYTGTARCNVNTSTSLTPGDAGCVTDGFYFNSGSSGNNQLDPYRANQIDLSYEYYFGKQGLISVGLFWKGVESFTQTSTVSVTVDDDFGGTAGGVTMRENGKGGRIQGIEFGAQYAFDMGLGFNLNYTYAQSSTANATDFDEHLGFPGVAQNAYTLQTYYEQGPIQARVSYTWKGKAVNPTYQTFAFASNADLSTKTYGIYDRSYGQVDAQVGYNFLDHFGVTLEARNLTAEATSSYLQFKNQPFLYNQPGRSYAISFKFDY